MNHLGELAVAPSVYVGVLAVSLLVGLWLTRQRH